MSQGSSCTQSICDPTVKRVLILFCLTFILLVGAKINFSSSGMLSQLYWDGEFHGIIAGTPKQIRGDEWAIWNLWTMSQIRMGFPTENENIGIGKSPLLFNVPVHHWSTLLRPQFWGFFTLDTERGYSFFWLYRALFLPLSVYLAGLVLSRQKHAASALAAVWVTFSGFLQWWFSTVMPDLVSNACLIFVCLSILLFSSGLYAIIGAALGLLVFSVNFLMAVYPPFQIVLSYFVIAALMVRFSEPGSFEDLKRNFKFKIFALLCVCAAFLAVAAVLFVELDETMRVVVSTEYPGQRQDPGGLMPAWKYFSELLVPFFKEGNVPRSLNNICETSGFLMLWMPVAFVVIVHRGARKAMAGALPLLVLVVILSIWHLWGFPSYISAASGLSRVQSLRMDPALGISGILFCVLYLYCTILESMPPRLLLYLAIGLFIGLLSFVIPEIGRLAPDRITPWVLSISLAVAAIMTACLLFRRRVLFFFAISVWVIYPNASVNPINQGLPDLLLNPVFAIFSSAAREKPDARWAVFDDATLANLAMAAGARVINGTHYSPDVDLISKFDKMGDSREIYNRYGHITLYRAEPGMTPRFGLLHQDSYTITLDPCDPVFENINVRYFAFRVPVDESRYGCLKMKSSVAGKVYLYQR